MNKIDQKLLSLQACNPEILEELRPYLSLHHYPKGAVISHRTPADPVLYYLEKGLLISIRIKAGICYVCRAATEGFLFPDPDIPDVQDAYFRLLEESFIWSVNLNQVKVLAQRNPRLLLMYIELLEEELKQSRTQEMQLRIPNAGLRFREYAAGNGSLVYKLNNETLAGLLNISKNHLFKIRKQFLRS